LIYQLTLNFSNEKNQSVQMGHKQIHPEADGNKGEATYTKIGFFCLCVLEGNS